MNVEIVRKKLSYYIEGFSPSVLAFSIWMVLVVFSLIISDLTLQACDSSEYLNNPMRILNGELPYRDFWLLFSPGEVYFPALIYKIFGVNTDILRIITLMTSCLIGSISFYIAKELLNSNFRAVICAFTVYFTSTAFHYEGPEYIQLYIVFLLISVLNLVRFYKYDKITFLLLSGLFIGIAALFRLYESGATYAAFLLSLIIFLRKSKYNTKEITKYIFIFNIGIIIVFGLCLLIFRSIAGVMLNEIIFESVRNGTSMNLPYFQDMILILKEIEIILGGISSSRISKVLSLPYQFYKLIYMALFYLMPAISVYFFYRFMRLKPEKKELYLSMIFLLWGIIIFLKGTGRSDLAHLAPAMTPFVILIFLIYDKLKNQRSNLRTNKTKLNYQISFVVLLLLLTLFFPMIKIGKLISNTMFYVKAPNGTIAFKQEQESEDFSKTLNFILSNTSVNDYIFVTPWDAPPIYALTGRRNPTYYDSMNDPIVRPSPEKQYKIIKQLKFRNTKYIIHNADWGYDKKPWQQFRYSCPILQDYIETDYNLVRDFGFYKIYEKK